ncbi:MAG: GIY-YIG nuclease family protein [Holophagales bacterium]|nr:GIY-YIG nuclease family protein [Holophagales bacterium]
MRIRTRAAPIDPVSLPAVAGSYVLELHLERRATLEVGRLGTVVLGPGRVRYYGSARGPGGVRARVARHLRCDRRRQHWHVDALSSRFPVARVLFTEEESECDLLRHDLASGRWRVAVAGFGSSDCRSCPAHLLVERA